MYEDAICTVDFTKHLPKSYMTAETNEYKNSYDMNVSYTKFDSEIKAKQYRAWGIRSDIESSKRDISFTSWGNRSDSKSSAKKCSWVIDNTIPPKKCSWGNLTQSKKSDPTKKCSWGMSEEQLLLSHERNPWVNNLPQSKKSNDSPNEVTKKRYLFVDF